MLYGYGPLTTLRGELRKRTESRDNSGSSAKSNSVRGGLRRPQSQKLFFVPPDFEDEELKTIFVDMCNKYLCEESIMFILAVLDLAKQEDKEPAVEPTVLLSMSREIVTNYVRPGSPLEVNISSNQVKRVIAAFDALEREFAQGRRRSGTTGSRGSTIKTGKSSQKTPTELPAPLPLPVPAANGAGVAGSYNNKFSSIFVESYAEILKMLSQNITPRLHCCDEYHAAMASYVMRQEQIRQEVV